MHILTAKFLFEKYYHISDMSSPRTNMVSHSPTPKEIFYILHFHYNIRAMGKRKLPNIVQLALFTAAALSIVIGAGKLPIQDTLGLRLMSVSIIFYAGFVLGRATENWILMKKNRDTVLKEGIYTEHSHPIYLGTFMLFAGLALLFRSTWGLVFATLWGLFLTHQSIKEGREVKKLEKKSKTTDR